MRKPNLNTIIENNLDKAKFQSKVQPSLPEDGWLSAYKNGGTYISDRAQATQFGQYKMGGGMFPPYHSFTPPRMKNGGPGPEEVAFQKFFKTLPMNLRRDQPDYNIRGYWDALGRPSEFDWSQPKQDDGYYHAFSRNPETGEILKAPFHHTFKMAIDRGNPDYLPIVTPEGKIKTITGREYFPQEEIPVNVPLRQGLQFANGGDISIPNLQEGNWLNRYDVGGFTVTDETTKPKTKCKDGYGCHGTSKTMSGEGIKKIGVRDQPSDAGSGSPENYVALSNAPTTWEELQTYNETNPKDKDFKNRLKFLQGQFPGLTQNQLLVAGADSARIRQRMTNLPRYDQPSEQTYDRAYHMFYRPLMNQPTPVTIPQILQYQSQQPGGLQGFESTVRGNYGRPKAQNGQQVGNPDKPYSKNNPQGYVSMKNNQDWFNSHANWTNTGNPEWDAKVRQQVMTGRFGVDPNSGALIKLPQSEWTNISDEDKRLATDKRQWTPAQKQQSWERQVKPYIQQGTKDLITNPVMMAPGAILTGGMAAGIPAIAETAAAIAPALETSIAGVPGLTAGNILNAGFAYEGAKNIPNVYNAWKQVGSKPTWSNIGNAAGQTAVTGLDMLPFGMSAYKGIPSVMQDINQAGKYLTTQTPLKNTYKINPWAIKENPEMFLYRARPVGQDINMNMAAQLRAKQAAGEPLTWYQKNLLNPQTNPELLAREKYYGQWFEKDPNRLDWYMDPATRNFADNDAIEILRTRLPKSEAAKLNISQFPDAKVLSASPETEFILPKGMIESAERFPESSLQQLIQEDKKFNTPNWLRGFSKPKSKVSNSIMRNAEGQIQFLDDAAYRDALVTGKKNVINYLSDPRYASVVEQNQQMANRLGLNQTLPIQREMAQPSLYEARLAKINEPLSLNDPRSLEMDIINNNSSVGAQYVRSLNGKGSLTIPRVHSPSQITRNTSHEVLHHIYPNLGEGYPSFTPLEARKAKSVFKSSEELRKIEEANNVPYWYLDDVDELVPNSFDLANDLGIEKFQKYPGMESFKNMLNSYSGDKKFIRDALKLDNKRDYKRAWDMLSGVRLGVVPAVLGAAALQKQKKGGMITDPRGQWAHPGQNTRIPGNNITMQGVPYPVLAKASNGMSTMMYPGREYSFPGASHVDEYPMMQNGGETLPPIYTDDPDLVQDYNDSLHTFLAGQENLRKLKSAGFKEVKTLSPKEYENYLNSNPQQFKQTFHYNKDNIYPIQYAINDPSSNIGYSLKKLNLKEAPEDVRSHKDHTAYFNFPSQYKELVSPASFKYTTGELRREKNTKTINGKVTEDSGWKVTKNTMQKHEEDESTRGYLPLTTKPSQPYILGKPPEPTLNKQVTHINPISAGSITSTPGLRTMQHSNIQMSGAVPQGNWNVEYLDPNSKKTETKHFITDEQAEEFYNDPANRASRKYSNASSVGRMQNGGWLQKYQDGNQVTYTVKKGDTLGKIGKQFGMTPQQIADANNISNIDFIRTNQKLNIPGVGIPQQPVTGPTDIPIAPVQFQNTLPSFVQTQPTVQGNYIASPDTSINIKNNPEIYSELDPEISSIISNYTTPSTLDSAEDIKKRETARRIVEIARKHIAMGKKGYFEVPPDVAAASLREGKEPAGCVGGACKIAQEAGAMPKVFWSNTAFTKAAPELGFPNKGYGLRGIQNLEPGDFLTHQTELGGYDEKGNPKYIPRHTQIFLGINPQTKEYEFFDNYHKRLMSYSEDDIRDKLKQTKNSYDYGAVIYKMNPFHPTTNSYTDETVQQAADKELFVKEQMKNPSKYKYSIRPDAKDYNDSTKGIMNTFVNYANDDKNITDLVSKLKVGKDEIHDSLLNVFGELGQENNWSNSGKGLKSKAENVAEKVLTFFGGAKRYSVGPGQNKFSTIPEDLREQFGIKSPKDLYDINKVIPLMVAEDIRNKQVLRRWGQQNVLSHKLIGHTDKENPLRADDLKGGVGRWSPYLRNEFGLISSGKRVINNNDLIPWNGEDVTWDNWYKPGAGKLVSNYDMNAGMFMNPRTLAEGSYPDKVFHKTDDNLQRTLITPNTETSPDTLSTQYVFSKAKKKKEFGGQNNWLNNYR